MTSTATVEKALEDNPGFWRLEIIRDGQRIRQFLR
jgi:hypothetical protein